MRVFPEIRSGMPNLSWFSDGLAVQAFMQVHRTDPSPSLSPSWFGRGASQPADLRPVLPFGLPAPALIRGSPSAVAFGAAPRLASPRVGLSIGTVPATTAGDAP